MAVHNTFSDASNTAVRAFLTKVGSLYWGKDFNVSTGEGKKTWERIKIEFSGSCCYCGKKTPDLTMEHLIMFNRSEYGLHHPGNVVPCCKACNKRGKKNNDETMSWREHLKSIAKNDYDVRSRRIENHIKKYNYPNLTENEIKAIRVIAGSLYRNIGLEGEKSYTLYEHLRKEFLNQGE